jgi:hypothetical protein
MWNTRVCLFAALATVLAFSAPGIALAQTKLTTGASFCGATAYPNCVVISFTTGGTMWVRYDPKLNKGFIQFSDVEPSEFTATTSWMRATFTAIDPAFEVPGEPSTFDPDNHYVLTIHTFGGRDSDGDGFYGTGHLNFHFIMTRGSGRGGGGGGLKLIQDAGGVIMLTVK